MARSSVKKSKSTRRGSAVGSMGFGKQMLKLGGDALIRQAQKYISGQSRTRLEEALKKKKKKGRWSEGRYVGRFNRKTSKVFKTEKTYGEKGCLSSVEVSGNVQDPNVCWVGHTTSMQFEVQRLYIMAIYRKLFEKISMMKVESINQPVSEHNLTGAILSIEVADEDDAGFASYGQTLSASDTLNTLADLANPVAQYLVRDPTSVNHTLFRYLRLSFGTAGNRYAQIDLRGVRVHYNLKSVMKIQNASTFVAGDNEADDVNAVHLTGRMFKFNTANCRPRKFIKDGANKNVEFMSDENGVNLQKGSLISVYDRGFNEVPTKGMFTNCTHASKINLEPGKIKSDKLSYSNSLSLVDFIKVWAEPILAERNIVSDKRRGPLHMLILEKQINFGTNPINLYYEKQQNIGVYITEKAASTIIQDYYARAFSRV